MRRKRSNLQVKTTKSSFCNTNSRQSKPASKAQVKFILHHSVSKLNRSFTISLRIIADCANFVRFRGLQPLLPHVCPVSVRLGGNVGYIQKAFEKGYLEPPGLHAVLTICLRIWSVLDGACVACGLFLLPCPPTNSTHVLLFPLMHHKSLWCAKELALGDQSGCR